MSSEQKTDEMNQPTAERILDNQNNTDSLTESLSYGAGSGSGPANNSAANIKLSQSFGNGEAAARHP